MQQHNPESTEDSSINTGNVSGKAIAIGHGAQATYQEILRPLPVKYSALVRILSKTAGQRVTAAPRSGRRPTYADS